MFLNKVSVQTDNENVFYYTSMSNLYSRKLYYIKVGGSGSRSSTRVNSARLFTIYATYITTNIKIQVKIVYVSGESFMDVCKKSQFSFKNLYIFLQFTAYAIYVITIMVVKFLFLQQQELHCRKKVVTKIQTYIILY